MELSAGDVVYSKAGRDKGKNFVVMEIVDEQYVFICDGKVLSELELSANI